LDQRLKDKTLEQQPKELCRQVLLGSLLASGGIHKSGGVRLIYRERQPRETISHLRWKSKLLTNVGARVVGLDGSPVLEVPNHQDLQVLRDAFYGEHNHKCNIPLGTGAALGYVGLLILYIDAGRMLGPHYAGIKLKNYSRSDVQDFVSGLNSHLNLSLYLSKDCKYPRIVIDKKNLVFLYKLWLPLCDTLDLPKYSKDKIVELMKLLPVGKVVIKKTNRTKTRQCIKCSLVKDLNVDNFPKLTGLGVCFGYSLYCGKCASLSDNHKSRKENLLHIFHNFPERTNANLGRILGLSRERIRQLRKSYKMKPNLTKEEKDLVSAKKAKLRCKKYFCKTNNIPFTLCYEDIEWPSHCPILGIELDYFADIKKASSPSFDRINPKLGYLRGNVCIISSRATTLKNSGTSKEHRLISDYIDKHDNVTVL